MWNARHLLNSFEGQDVGVGHPAMQVPKFHVHDVLTSLHISWEHRTTSRVHTIWCALRQSHWIRPFIEALLMYCQIFMTSCKTSARLSLWTS